MQDGGYKNKDANSVFYQTNGSWEDPLLNGSNEFNKEFSSPIVGNEIISNEPKKIEPVLTYKQPKNGINDIVQATREKNFNPSYIQPSNKGTALDFINQIPESQKPSTWKGEIPETVQNRLSNNRNIFDLPRSRDVDPVTKTVLSYLLAPPQTAIQTVQQIPQMATEVNKLGEEGGLPLRALGSLNATIHTVFGTQTPFNPVLTGFTLGGKGLEDIGLGPVQNAIMSPLQTLINPESGLGKETTKLGDLAWNLVLLKKAHDLGKIPAEYRKQLKNNYNEVYDYLGSTPEGKAIIKDNNLKPFEKLDIRPNLTKPVVGVTQEKLHTELLSKIENNIKKAEDIIQQRDKTLEKPYYEDVNNVPKLAEKISKGKRLNRSELQLQKNFPKELETKLQEIKNASTISETKTSNGDSGTPSRRDIIKEQRRLKDVERGTTQVRLNKGEGLTNEQTTESPKSKETQEPLPTDVGQIKSIVGENNYNSIKNATERGKSISDISTALNLSKRDVAKVVRSLGEGNEYFIDIQGTKFGSNSLEDISKKYTEAINRSNIGGTEAGEKGFTGNAIYDKNGKQIGHIS